MKPVAVYLRVSTEDQSHESQRADVLRWLEREGIDLAKVEWYEDVESGRTIKRPAFDRLRSDVKSGERKTVVVYALDRMSRDFFDGVEVLGSMLKAGARVASVTEPLDLSGELGQALAGVLFALGAIEWRKRKDRQRSGIEIAKANGTYKGRKPGSLKADASRAVELWRKQLNAEEIAKSLGVTRRTVWRYLAAAGIRGIPSGS